MSTAWIWDPEIKWTEICKKASQITRQLTELRAQSPADARRGPIEFPPTRHDRSTEKTSERNSVDAGKVSTFPRSLNEGSVEVPKDCRLDVELLRVQFKGALDPEIEGGEIKDRQVDKNHEFNSEQTATSTRTENPVGVEQVILRIDDVDLRPRYQPKQFLDWMLSLVRTNPKAVMLKRAHVSDVG
jgi:hypothetical protein